MTKRVFGLTGGIAAGKSTVSKYMAIHGVTIVDADQIARKVVLPGTPGLAQVVEKFGSEFLLEDGTLNRQMLGQLVFSDKLRREELESILLPLIYARANEEIAEAKDGLVCFDAPTLIETKQYQKYQPLVVVITDPEDQIRRTMKRNNLSREAAKARVDSQVSNEVRRELATYVVDTSGSFEDTRQTVRTVLLALQGIS